MAEKKKPESIDPIAYKLWDAESNIEDIIKDFSDKLTLHEQNMLRCAYNSIIAVERLYINRGPVENK